MRRRPDIDKVRRIVGWQPRVTFEEGIAATVDYLREEMGRQPISRGTAGNGFVEWSSDSAEPEEKVPS